MRSASVIATVVASYILAAGNPAVAADAGSIQQVSGNVTIIGSDKAQRKAGTRDRIQSGDTLLTEARSEAVVKMADDSAVVLRPNTQFQITDFKFEQKPTDTSVVTLLRGTARLISGLIGKASPSRVSVVAATATIGIRGTDFEVSVIQTDTPEGRAGVYNYVHDGGTRIQIASGQNLDVQKEQTAFAPEKPNPGEEPLQLLRERPIFLQQGGGLDALIQSITIMPPMMMR
jgi:FecR protein